MPRENKQTIPVEYFTRDATISRYQLCKEIFSLLTIIFFVTLHPKIILNLIYKNESSPHDILPTPIYQYDSTVYFSYHIPKYIVSYTGLTVTIISIGLSLVEYFQLSRHPDEKEMGLKNKLLYRTLQVLIQGLASERCLSNTEHYTKLTIASYDDLPTKISIKELVKGPKEIDNIVLDEPAICILSRLLHEKVQYLFVQFHELNIVELQSKNPQEEALKWNMQIKRLLLETSKELIQLKQKKDRRKIEARLNDLINRIDRDLQTTEITYQAPEEWRTQLEKLQHQLIPKIKSLGYPCEVLLLNKEPTARSCIQLETQYRSLLPKANKLLLRLQTKGESTEEVIRFIDQFRKITNFIKHNQCLCLLADLKNIPSKDAPAILSEIEKTITENHEIFLATHKSILAQSRELQDEFTTLKNSVERFEENLEIVRAKVPPKKSKRAERISTTEQLPPHTQELDLSELDFSESSISPIENEHVPQEEPFPEITLWRTGLFLNPLVFPIVTDLETPLERIDFEQQLIQTAEQAAEFVLD